MGNSFAGVDATPLLMERYPEIGFHLTFDPFEEESFDVPNVSEWKSRLDLEGVDILFVYGLGLGAYYESLKKWVHERKERALVFIEDDLAAIAAFAKGPHAEELLNDPQAHLRFVAGTKLWNEALEELAHTFPCDRIECSAASDYAIKKKSRFKKMRLQLMRNVAAIQALLSEALHYHILFANLASNFKLLAGAFYANKWEGKFKGIPAVICGAGPSLAKSIETLKKLDNRALIIAGGSTITALSVQGVVPHLGIALDPNHDEYLRLKPAASFETPLLFANRVYPDIFYTCNGPLGYMRSDTGGTAETWMEKKLKIKGEAIGPDLGREAFSVTTIGIALAQLMGCDPIILNGIDLAYTGMNRYSEGVMASSQVFLEQMKKEKRATERLLRRKDRLGKTAYTLVKWVMESVCIGNFAKAHPETSFINCTQAGLGFPGVPYHSWEKAASKYCSKEYDLRGKLHAEMQNTLMTHVTSSKVSKAMKQLKESLKRCDKICDEMLEEIGKLDPKGALEETGKMVILQIDLQEEPAFDALLQTAGPAIDRLMDRCYPSLAADRKRERLNEKWKQFKFIVQSHLHIL